MLQWLKGQFSPDETGWLRMWEKRRRLGLFGFVMVFGFGAFGLGLGAVAVCVGVALKYAIDGPEVKWGEVGVIAVLYLSTTIPLGLMTSVYIWFWGERRYKRLQWELDCEPTPSGTGDPDAG